RRADASNGDDRVADPDRGSFNHACGDAAEAAHRVVPTGAEDLFHARARMAFAARLEQRRADAKAPALEGDEIDAANDDVAAHFFAVDTLAAQMAGDRGQALGLDQRQ